MSASRARTPTGAPAAAAAALAAGLLAWSAWRLGRSFVGLALGPAPISLGTAGWDFEVYCAAGAAAAEGRDPYIAAQVGGRLTYNYAPLLLPAFRAWCGTAPPHPLLYLVPYAAIVAVAAWLAGVGGDLRERLVAAAIVVGGFNAAQYVLATGNLAIVELLLCAVAGALVIRQRPVGAGAALGIAASLKLLPLVLVAAPAGASLDRRTALAVLGAGACGFAALLVLSAVVAPELMPSFAAQVAGLHPHQHSPLRELASPGPSLYGLVSGELRLPLPIVVTGAVSAALVIPAALHARRVARAACATAGDRIAATMLLWIALVAVIPRLNYYGFVLATVPIAILARTLGPLHQALAMVQAVAGIFLLSRLPHEIRTSTLVTVHGPWLVLAVLYLHLLAVLWLDFARRARLRAAAANA